MNDNNIPESKSDGDSSSYSNMEHKEIHGEDDGFDIMEGLGIAKDAVSVAGPGVDTGFSIARSCTNFGFSIATGILDGISSVGKAVSGESNPVSLGLDIASSVVGMSGKLTDGILEGSKLITKSSLAVSDNVLAAFGARDGASLRALGCSEDKMEALQFILKLLQQFGDGLDLSPVALYEAFSLIMSIQEICDFNAIKPAADEQKLDEDLFCYLPWALGCYGKLIMQHLLGHAPRNVRGAQEGFRGAYEKLTGGTIIMSKLGTNTYEPSHVLGIDRQGSAVVLAFRGTLSLGDALTDLMCEHMPYTFQNVGDGHVHKGFYKSAKTICSNLRAPIFQTLDVSVLAGVWVLNRFSDVLGDVIEITSENNSGYPRLNINALQSSTRLKFVIPPVSEALPNPLPSYTCTFGAAQVVIQLQRGSFSFPTIDISIVNSYSLNIERYTAYRQSAVFAAPFRVVLCGHSLGAAIAQVVTSIWLATSCFGPYDLVCFAYGPPCVFSMPLARHPIFLKSIYSVVVGHDIVSRLCIGSAWDLRELIMNLQNMKREEPDSYKQIQDTISLLSDRQDQKAALKILLVELQSESLPRRKMFPAGRTFHIPSGEALRPEQQEGIQITEFHCNCLSSISVHSAMLSDHMAVFKTISQSHNL